jgi:hypothetical protein
MSDESLPPVGPDAPPSADPDPGPVPEYWESEFTPKPPVSYVNERDRTSLARRLFLYGGRVHGGPDAAEDASR